MRHTHKDFWFYAGIYLTLGTSLLILVISLLEVALQDKELNIGGAGGGLMIGILGLIALHRKRLAEAKVQEAKGSEEQEPLSR